MNQNVLAKCSHIMSDHNLKLAGHIETLVVQCPMTDCYFQHCTPTKKLLSGKFR